MNLISLLVIFTYFVHCNVSVKSSIGKPNRTETVSDFDVSTELYHSDEFCDPSNTLICNEHYSPRLCICYTNHMLDPKGAINKTHPPLCKSIIPVRHVRNFVLTFAIRFPVPEYFVSNPDLAFTTAMEIYTPPITKENIVILRKGCSPDRKRFIFQIGIVLSRNKSQNTTHSRIPFRITEDDLQIVFPSSFTHNSLFMNMKVLNIASVEEIEDEFAVLVDVEENNSQKSLSKPDENTYFIRCPVRKPNLSRFITSEDTEEMTKSSEEHSFVEFSSDVGTTPKPDTNGFQEITAAYSNQHLKNVKLIVSTSQTFYEMQTHRVIVNNCILNTVSGFKKTHPPQLTIQDICSLVRLLKARDTSVEPIVIKLEGHGKSAKDHDTVANEHSMQCALEKCDTESQKQNTKECFEVGNFITNVIFEKSTNILLKIHGKCESA
ncbi:hypothetical protein Ddc_02563 [Ditylenchus destructor]|nr:hypothetical protein Ddc_02563 [Ditylenchus destructor]